MIEIVDQGSIVASPPLAGKGLVWPIARGDSMRRMTAVMVWGVVVLTFGCSNRYDERTRLTIEKMKYERKVNENLQLAPTDGPLKDKDIYVRAPKPLEPSKEPSLGSVQPGMFDAAESFYDKTNTFLHVLARVKTPKKAPAKGAPPEPVVPRQPFNADVLAQLKSVYGDDENIAIEKFKDDSVRPPVATPITYKKGIFTANGKTVEAYIYKGEPYEVALIFVYDPADRVPMGAKIRLALESFAVGSKAKVKYSGSSGEEGEEVPGGNVPL
jgi:hypothetical protein